MNIPFATGYRVQIPLRHEGIFLCLAVTKVIWSKEMEYFKINKAFEICDIWYINLMHIEIVIPQMKLSIHAQVYLNHPWS